MAVLYLLDHALALTVQLDIGVETAQPLFVPEFHGLVGLELE